jgi:hypothetical protein
MNNNSQQRQLMKKKSGKTKRKIPQVVAGDVPDPLFQRQFSEDLERNLDIRKNK